MPVLKEKRTNVGPTQDGLWHLLGTSRNYLRLLDTDMLNRKLEISANPSCQH